jgi:hypothetical protein
MAVAQLVRPTMKRLLHLLSAIIACSVCRSSAELVSYSYTGATANGDSTITAWFQFDSSAMSDRGVRFTEILQYSFLVTGSDMAMNGQYDLLLGGGIGFDTTTPGPLNLPVIQSLVIENTLAQTIIISDNLGDPGIFVGGTLGTGPPVYSGEWTFGVVPEPSTISLLSLMGCIGWGATRRSRIVKRVSPPRG